MSQQIPCHCLTFGLDQSTNAEQKPKTPSFLPWKHTDSGIDRFPTATRLVFTGNRADHDLSEVQLPPLFLFPVSHVHVLPHPCGIHSSCVEQSSEPSTIHQPSSYTDVLPAPPPQVSQWPDSFSHGST
ncbi:hypothetical protein V2G26_019719 [Clonostachys chloroleuca]